MALAPYFSRVSDAIGGVAPIRPDQLEELLGANAIRIRFGNDVVDDPALWQGARFLANLVARLYPRLELVGPEGLVTDCAALAHSVNPNIELGSSPKATGGVDLAYSSLADGDAKVHVGAHAWTVFVDRQDVARTLPPSPLTALAAACIGAAELFRVVFASALGSRGRTRPQSGTFVLSDSSAPTEIQSVALPPLHLAGVGAIGQACIQALVATGATGTITLVDPECVELSNLQRYVLSRLTDVGAPKVQVAARVLEAAGWKARPVQTVWGADANSGPNQGTVVVALDTARDRLSVAAGLHQTIFNAWTQPSDLGWSRHENFGVEPCLACLYYPDRAKPSEDQLVAAALGQHRLRVLSYFTARVPLGMPLPLVAPVADMPPPPEAERWLSASLIDDLVEAGVVPPDQRDEWASRSIGELYSEGVCGGGLLQSAAGSLQEEAVVPLAHQSALAGVMLAFEVVSAFVPELAISRPTEIEQRFDVLSGLPQILSRPRARTSGCFCSDPAYVAAARRRPAPA